jgi:hypothetical protein
MDTNNEYFEANEYEEGVNDVETDITQIFDNPYIVKVSYELNRNDLDEIYSRNLEDNQITDYVYDNILGNYYSNGFLALSSVGEFVLIRRFEQSIRQLEMDECYSPNLAMWLFNVRRARLPETDHDDTVIDKWLNKNIEANENQKKAVYKMLQAPDLCLIQGPPGTGKTTVIAEAIYQFVRTGNRVLVASQSNDAVDNALERLADTPEIRAIRLGQKGRKKKKTDDLNTRKFSEDEALKYYYSSLSLQISNTWLNLWSDLEQKIVEYDTDIRDAKLYYQDMSELTIEYSNVSNDIIRLRDDLNNGKIELEKANEFNMNAQNEKQQYLILVSDIKNGLSEKFYLSENQLKILETVLNPIIIEAIQQGIFH